MKSLIRNLVIGVAMLLLVTVAWEAFAPQYPRSELPSTATEIHDYDTSGLIGIQRDYFYLLTATIDETEFHTFISEIGFVESDLDVEWWPNMNGFDWWTPSESSDSIFTSTSRWKPNAVAKYEGGRLYYKEWSGY